MGKKHFFSAHSDFKTGFFCKFFLILGCILVLFYIIELLFHMLGLLESLLGTILAFAILCLGIGGILFFFSCQFAKLSQIATEIEEDESLLDDEENKEQ